MPQQYELNALTDRNNAEEDEERGDLPAVGRFGDAHTDEDDGRDGDRDGRHMPSAKQVEQFDLVSFKNDLPVLLDLFLCAHCQAKVEGEVVKL